MDSLHYNKCLKTPYRQIGESSISPTDQVQNLGVMFDNFINMNDHVTSVCTTAYYHLKKIRSLEPFLITVVHAFVTSRIDYCNSLLYDRANYNINRFQRIQNDATCMVTNNGKYSHVRIILEKLLWLPVKQRVLFKILITTCKCTYGEAPKYLCDLPLMKISSHLLRSYSRCQCLCASVMLITHLV